jgi:curved DNA-binding protein CbpA
MRLSDQSEDEEKLLRLAEGCDPAAFVLSPAEGFLLSRIDGRTSQGVLRRIGALAPAEIDRCVARWLEAGVLELTRAELGGEEARVVRAEGSPPLAATQALPALDPSLELDASVQAELLAFAQRLHRPYHEILGVPRDADARTIKKAYFALSKRLHPDRYFRRRLGAFAPLIDACFKKLLEAYELLSDPATRAALQAAPSPAADVGPSHASGLAVRRRLRQRVGALGAAKRASEERRRKAKGFFESGMASFAKERWLEAAGSVRLAIAFDPENEAYRERFSEVQRRAHDERARALVRQAEGALELRDFAQAVNLLEEAVDYRPADPELSIRAAKISWQALRDMRRAKELAVHAVELAPENGGYRRLLGLVYRDAGLTANARRELETALRLDPQDAEARAALRAL